MNKAVLALAGISALLISGAADARCVRAGHHLACRHHGHHIRLLAANYAAPYPYAYGYGFGSYGTGAASDGSSGIGPSPHGSGGP